MDPLRALGHGHGHPPSPRLGSALQRTVACGGGTFLGTHPPPPAPAPHLTSFSSLTPRPIFSLPSFSSLLLSSPIASASQRTHLARLSLLRCQCQTCNKLIVALPSPSCSLVLPLLAWPRSSPEHSLPPPAFQRLACRSARYRGSPINPLLSDPTSASIPATRAQDPLATRFFTVHRLEINQPSLSTARLVCETLALILYNIKHPTARQYCVAHLYFQRAIYILEEIVTAHAERWVEA